ncbi:MAG TPA: hypothetical protein VKY85_14085 [Candidatus Angelobacter sp.]|nr:hypothetical protein [Candidatus Angelobacter sp.]
MIDTMTDNDNNQNSQITTSWGLARASAPLEYQYARIDTPRKETVQTLTFMSCTRSLPNVPGQAI